MKKRALVADAGGTNIRFALVDLEDKAPALQSPKKYTARDFSGVEDAIKTYLADQKLDAAPALAVFSVAGPVSDNAITMTNLGWSFSGASVGLAFGIAQVRLINDYEAIARSIPALTRDDLRDIGPHIDVKREDREIIAIIGPGTGLGIGGYVRQQQAMIPLVTEGGHARFAPADDVEIEILKILHRKFGHVSNERILSGPGLARLYEALSAIEGSAAEAPDPHAITVEAVKDPSSLSGRVLSRFCAILGSVAADVALIQGARDGLMLAGGILPAVVDFFGCSEFRARFEAKGRFEWYMKAIPTRLIVNDNAGMIGAAALARSMAGQ